MNTLSACVCARSLVLTLLALAGGAQAQNTSAPVPNPSRTSPMSATSPSVTAFFYQQPVVLEREQHKALRFKPTDARFAAHNQAVPLLAAEFPEACLEYPIVFTKAQDGQWLALALTGLLPQANAFVDAQGVWNARYVPASVRRYPFILAEGANDQLSLAADLKAAHFGPEGDALFDDKGEPTGFVRSVMALLADYQSQARRTAALARQLEDAGLLKQQNLQVRQGEDRSAVVEGVWIVDEARLRDLPDAQVLAWFKNGELAAIHAHMLSLRNLVPLLERSQPPVAAQPARKAAGKAKAT